MFAEALRAAKRSLDPNGVLNPGCWWMCSPVKVLFLDESGDHNLTVIDPNYPVFVLGGVIVDQEYADGPLAEAFRSIQV